MSNYSYQGFSYRMVFSSTVKTLVIINILVFILINLFPKISWFFLLGLVPRFFWNNFMFWQVITHIFLHAGLWHLVINMLMLWMFGSVLEASWGSRKFLSFYFFTGIGAGLFSVIFMPGLSIPIVGASGAIFGLLAAFGVMFPESVILVFFIFPMKMKHAVIVLAAVNLLAAISSGGSGTAYITHLGGGVLGYLYLKGEWLRFNASRFSIYNIKEALRKKQQEKAQNRFKDIDKQVDAILDKISEKGMNSLTKQEKEILELKSKMNS